jgi:hypothetical protein
MLNTAMTESKYYENELILQSTGWGSDEWVFWIWFMRGNSYDDIRHSRNSNFDKFDIFER